MTSPSRSLSHSVYIIDSYFSRGKIEDVSAHLHLVTIPVVIVMKLQGPAENLPSAT